MLRYDPASINSENHKKNHEILIYKNEKSIPKGDFVKKMRSKNPKLTYAKNKEFGLI